MNQSVLEDRFREILSKNGNVENISYKTNQGTITSVTEGEDILDEVLIWCKEDEQPRFINDFSQEDMIALRKYLIEEVGCISDYEN